MDTSETPTDQRPTWACLLHRPPADGLTWTAGDPGYRTCSACLDRLRERLAEVAQRYGQLDVTPGGSGGSGGRGAPGFGSRSPASEHVIAMTDTRSSVVAKVWVAGDKRVHCESERPPLSVRGELETAAWTVAEAREIDGPHDRCDVATLVRWLDGHLDWVTRQHEVLLDLDAVLRRLLAQLRPATGQPRPSYIGHCPNPLDFAPDLGWAPAYEEDPGVPIAWCGARLYAPAKGDTIRCRNDECRAIWLRQDWLRLGDLLAVA